MRIPEKCGHCGHSIERERIQGPVPSSLNPLSPKPEPAPYIQQEWHEYYANGIRAFACPGCGSQFPLNEKDRERQKTHQLRISINEFARTLDLPPFVNEINELITQRVWEQAAIKEKDAMQRIADMWQIVQEVANGQSTIYSDNVGRNFCPFCNGKQNYKEVDYVAHEADCIVLKARALVEDQKKMDQATKTPRE